MGSFVEGSKNPATKTSTPKFVEEVVIKLMYVDKAVELFQTTAIVSLEVSSLRNRLAIDEKEKVVLQVELDKERDFQKEHKHNIEIWRKNMIQN
jgi:hypothetical protein